MMKRNKATSNACHPANGGVGVLPYLPVVMPRASGGPKGSPLTFLVVLFAGALNLSFNWADYAWERVNCGIPTPEITCLVVPAVKEQSYPLADRVILAGTSRAVYRSLYKGREAQLVLEVTGSSKRVNRLYSVPGNPEVVYAATDSGLFFSGDTGQTWKRVFFANDSRERQCLDVLVNSKTVYLGTAGGLFLKETDGVVWQKAKGAPGRESIFCLAHDGEYIFAATKDRIFRFQPSRENFEEIFNLGGREVNGETEMTEVDSGEINGSERQIGFMATGPIDEKTLYVATSKGIFKSPDHGQSWETVDSSGVPRTDSTSLVISKSGGVVIGTNRGVWAQDHEGWIQLYKGMETNTANYLTLDLNGRLYAATNRGIYLLDTRKTFPLGKFASASASAADFINEPSIREVQEVAINYAEVHPSKIKSWRRLSQVKALMPEVSLDFDKTVTTALGSTYDRTAVGPQDWGVNLKWDMGELIWSAEQTSIDSRSKLMVELREDILDQVTRIYFERRRLQAEFIKSEDSSASAQFDKEIRIEELTALIDGFTGGWFSREIERSRMR